MVEADLSGLSILLVEDETLLRKQLAAELERLRAEVTGVGTLAAARQWSGEASFDFVLLDVHLPDGRGTDLLRDRAFPATTAVIVMTAQGGVEGAVEAMRLGALDYLVKPFDPGELPLVIARTRRARQSVRLDEHRRKDLAQTGSDFFFGGALAGLEKQLEKVLTADRRMDAHLPPVLIQGETGTGKTTVARWLHHQGPRAKAPLVEMNCSAVAETLAESELFGHERGAFTDARSARMGLFEAAHGGTLFLDELPSLSPGLQTKVLKTIEDHRIRRVGGTREIPVDVRIVAATHRDLRELVTSGRFREDLFHRLDLYRLQIPPLREREDLVRLAERLIERLCLAHRLPRKRLTPVGRKKLLAYSWPGNVRELSHELERAIVFEDSEEMSFEHLVTPISGTAPSPETAGWFNPAFRFPAEGFVLDDALGVLIRHALQQTGGNVSAAARLLGVTRDFLRYHLPRELEK